MLEKYYKYKNKYNNYLIIIKSGNFYEVLDKDAFIINRLFNYKIKTLSNTIICGFPIKSIDKVLCVLDDNHISYYVDDINIMKEYDDNNYNNYDYDVSIINYNIIRINKIINYLNENICNSELIDRIEGIYEG